MGCCGRACGCCSWVATSIPSGGYLFLFTTLCLGLGAGGAYLIVFGVGFMASTAGAFISKEVYVGALVMGSVVAALGIYGVAGVAAAVCRGAKDDHLKLHYVLSLLSLLVMLSFMTVCLLNANDADNLDAMLDYGWQHAFAAEARHGIISKAQVDAKCCGFQTANDRAVAPCPGNAAGGCVQPLRAELVAQFSLAGILFGAVAGGIVRRARGRGVAA